MRPWWRRPAASWRPGHRHPRQGRRGRGNQQVVQAGLWAVEKQLKSFTDELRVSKEIFKGNTVTVGGYFADYSSHDVWYRVTAT
jgi:hypothetical protein